MTATGIELAQPVIDLPASAQGGAVSLLPAQPAQKLAGFLPVLNALLDQSETAARQAASARPANRPGGMLEPKTVVLNQGATNDAVKNEAGRAYVSRSSSAPSGSKIKTGSGQTAGTRSHATAANLPAEGNATAVSQLLNSGLFAPARLLPPSGGGSAHSSVSDARISAGITDRKGSLDPGARSLVQPQEANTSGAGNAVGSALDPGSSGASGSRADLAFALRLNWQPGNLSPAMQTSARQDASGQAGARFPPNGQSTEASLSDSAPGQSQNFGSIGYEGSTSSHGSSASQVATAGVVQPPEAALEANAVTGAAIGVTGTLQSPQDHRPPAFHSPSANRSRVTAPALTFASAQNGSPDGKDYGNPDGADNGQDGAQGFETAAGEHSVSKDPVSPAGSTGDSSQAASTLFRSELQGAGLPVPSVRNASGDRITHPMVAGPDAVGERYAPGTPAEPSAEPSDDSENMGRESPDHGGGEHVSSSAGIPNSHALLSSSERALDRVTETRAALETPGAPMQAAPPVRNESAAGVSSENTGQVSQLDGPSLETTQSPAQPVREVSFHVQNDASKVDVQLAERAGRIQVAVRTADPELAKSLQSNLGDLVGRLQEHGFKTESWIPVAAQHGTAGGTSAGTLKDTSSFGDNPGRGDESAAGGQNHQQHSRQGSHQQQQGRWKSQFDAVLSPSNAGPPEA